MVKGLLPGRFSRVRTSPENLEHTVSAGPVGEMKVDVTWVREARIVAALRSGGRTGLRSLGEVPLPFF
jgi:hypothetical protein